MTYSEVFTFITAFTSMGAAAGSLLVAALIFYRLREDYRFMADAAGRLAEIERQGKESAYVSDQIANVLYDLYGIVASMKACTELSRFGYPVDDQLFEDMEKQVSLTEKHFAELGLFSHDSVRRKSVQQSLANMYGDLETLEIMQAIVDKKMGTLDEPIRGALTQLKRRLKQDRLYVDSQSWTGRPSGGAF
jgi:hypothetical protein